MKSPLTCEIAENRMKGTVSLGKQFGYYKEYRKKLAGISTHAIVTGSIYMLSSPIELTPLNCLHYILGLSQKVEVKMIPVIFEIIRIRKLHLAPASSWSTLPDRSLLCSPFPVGIGRCSCVIVKEISAIWLNLACFFRHQCVLAAVDVSEEDQNNLLRFVDNKESEYMRLQMHKMGVDDFELLTMIGKGAFGEVRICREKTTSSVYAMMVHLFEVIVLGGDWDHLYFYWGAYCILRLQAQKMYGNTWTEIAKVVSGLVVEAVLGSDGGGEAQWWRKMIGYGDSGRWT
nr:serine/threonine-protein kinase tricorner-like [Tanacetum cinerariifolium]